MTIAMQANRGHAARALVRAAHALERKRRRARPRLLEVGGNQTAREEPCARLGPVAIDVERRARAKAPRCAARVYAADEAADPFERPAILQLRRAAAAPRKHREAKAGVLVQRAPNRCERRDHRDLGIGKLPRELVLLDDLRIGPALGAIELGDERRPLVHPGLIDPVLVAVQGEQPAVRVQAHGIESVEYAVGRQAGERRSGHRSMLRYSPGG